ncbi:hypothetical protein FOPG_20133 [Fusarium oxysporum f. sp. conglutinans race 2 54008]|uniref:Uncharacterized protein n=1 Tax=Fusarium oxysporum f. sp. conglutinans race 2 54008 TaxID=1089457 RepID=X0GJV6_FUSOX|nr:hypothetical protein FOPG_20133 [Fusarium oxysporum f. sp. conglutinans race 2 54008]
MALVDLSYPWRPVNNIAWAKLSLYQPVPVYSLLGTPQTVFRYWVRHGTTQKSPILPYLEDIGRFEKGRDHDASTCRNRSQKEANSIDELEEADA